MALSPVNFCENEHCGTAATKLYTVGAIMTSTPRLPNTANLYNFTAAVP